MIKNFALHFLFFFLKNQTLKLKLPENEKIIIFLIVLLKE